MLDYPVKFNVVQTGGNNKVEAYVEIPYATPVPDTTPPHPGWAPWRVSAIAGKAAKAKRELEELLEDETAPDPVPLDTLD